MRILGIDYGEKNLGLAFSEGKIAAGIGSCSRKLALSHIAQTCQELEVEKLVLGIPQGRMEKPVRQFGKQLSQAVGLPVIYWDETLTSQEAREALVKSGGTRKRRRQKEHAVAAAILLQNYIEAKYE